MKKIGALLAALLVAGVVAAEPRNYTFPLAMTSNTASTGTMAGVVGQLVEITVSCSDNNSTGSMAIAYLPNDGLASAVNVATATVVKTKTWRPTVDSTDVAGAALTSDPPGFFYLAGETLRLGVWGSPTNKTWTATIKVDR